MTRSYRASLLAAAAMVLATAAQIFAIPSPSRFDSWDFPRLWILLVAGVVGWLGGQRSQLATAVGAAAVPALSVALTPLALPASFQYSFYPALVTVNVLVTFLSTFGASIVGAFIRSLTVERPVA